MRILLNAEFAQKYMEKFLLHALLIDYGAGLSPEFGITAIQKYRAAAAQDFCTIAYWYRYRSR